MNRFFIPVALVCLWPQLPLGVAVAQTDQAHIEASPAENSTTNLWSHIRNSQDLDELRDVTAQWDIETPGGALKLTASKPSRYAWAVVPPPQGGWKLGERNSVEAEITNRGAKPADIRLCIVGDYGWDAVMDGASLMPGETLPFRCLLRSTFPDGTPKVDPNHIKQVQVMIARADRDASVEVRNLVAVGKTPRFQPPRDRIVVPRIENAAPAAGRRVRYRLAGDEQSNIYSVLNLPSDWQPAGKYPLIVEYPGNIFFTTDCYSTGLPDQCIIGYGITKGRGAICLSLPFIDPSAGTIAENGWGDPDATADYAIRAVEEICDKFGGDRRNILLTGFSRGAIACGFIGLRNDRIAALWKGFHACQHYDGDGWNGATMDGALERASRFTGKAVFQTDNSRTMFQPLMDRMRAEATFVDSALGAHACAMFLDDRPSSVQLREWFAQLVASAD